MMAAAFLPVYLFSILFLCAWEQNRASQKINKLDPLKAFNTLRAQLPHKQTQRYLVKVMGAKKKFVNF